MCARLRDACIIVRGTCNVRCHRCATCNVRRTVLKPCGSRRSPLSPEPTSSSVSVVVVAEASVCDVVGCVVVASAVLSLLLPPLSSSSKSSSSSSSPIRSPSPDPSSPSPPSLLRLCRSNAVDERVVWGTRPAPSLTLQHTTAGDAARNSALQHAAGRQLAEWCDSGSPGLLGFSASTSSFCAPLLLLIWPDHAQHGSPSSTPLLCPSPSSSAKHNALVYFPPSI